MSNNAERDRILEKVRRLVLTATGEEYGDGYTVTDVIVGYAEPGYGSDDAVIVLGDWNPRRVEGIEDYWHSDDPRVTLPVRLARSLERVGADIAWLDEWYQCGNCYRAVRANADSYSWRPYYTMADGEITCADCLLEIGEDALEENINNPHSCVTWCNASHVESLGFVKWEPSEPHTYENGWHPGQTDDPQTIFDAILARYDEDDKPAPDVVFFLDESSQFYITFSAYVRDARESEED